MAVDEIEEGVARLKALLLAVDVSGKGGEVLDHGL
jgi:hypothetical protein